MKDSTKVILQQIKEEIKQADANIGFEEINQVPIIQKF